jgi:putative tryptophan/tyrosine transport system substrate-binding protein
MKRRDFFAFIGAAMVWPLGARGEPLRRIGILFGTSRERADSSGLLQAITEGLGQTGWIEGTNFTYECRFADGNYDVLPKLAAEVVHARAEVILTDGSAATQAAKAATTTIPIVALSNDPVASGFVASFNRPGGNITGVGLLGPELSGKRLQLMTDVVPGLKSAIVLSNPISPSHGLIIEQTKSAARSLGVEVKVAQAQGPDKLEDAFAAITAARVGALIVLPDAMLFAQHRRVVAYAAVARLPALFAESRVVQDGGFMAYGPNLLGAFKMLSVYADKILRGAKAADLPIEQPTTFELAVNLKTAKALGLAIPPALLATADQVIE